MIYLKIIIAGFGLIFLTIRGVAFARWAMLCFQLMLVMTVYRMWGELSVIGGWANALLSITSTSWWISIMVMFYSSSITEYYAEKNPLGNPIKSGKRNQIMQDIVSKNAQNDEGNG